MTTDKRCPGCGVAPGDEHTNGCGVARCLATGRQRLQCEMLATTGIGVNHDGDCGNDIWTGEWPGTEDAIRLGFWCDPTDLPLRPCDPDTPGAVPDLNRLMSDARWDPTTRRWEAR